MAVVASAMMVACGSKTDNAENNANGTEEVAVEAVEVEEVATPDATETVTPAEANSLLDNIKGAATSENVTKAINYVKELISSGKLSEAKSYLAQVKPYADKVGCSALVSQVEQAVSLAENASGNLKDQATEAGQKAVDDAKAKATDAVQKAASDATQKATDAVKGLF